MEAVLLIVLIIIIYLLVNLKSRQQEIAERTHQSFLSLKKELLEIKEDLKNRPLPDTLPAANEIIQWRPYVPPTPLPVTPAPVETETTKEEEPVVTIGAAVQDTARVTPVQPLQTPPTEPPYIKPVAKESSWEKWLRNNPDLEKFIGENLVNKIGITVLVLGIAFFVKYAIDQKWIGEAGRVAIGIGCGALLTGLAHYLRNSYRSFSSVLAGGGITVFYFTIAFGFHEYQLFSQTNAFVLMVAVTVFAVALSLLYNKLELAVIAAIGGFATPFLVSTGSGNYVVLFTYLVILNVGMLALAYFKRWQPITAIAVCFTLLIYGGWLVQQTLLVETMVHYKNGIGFATIFYVLFLAMTMVYNLRHRQSFKAIDFSLLLVVTFSYFAAGITNLHYWNEGAYQGLFTSVLGALNCGLAWYFYKSGKGDYNLLYLLIGLTLTFISLAVPIQLKGHTITLFWSAEFVLLYWLHQRSGITVFKYSSLAIFACMLVSLAMDWSNANGFENQHLQVLYNDGRGLVTNLAATIAMVLYAMLLRRQTATAIFVAGSKYSTISNLFIVAAIVLFYLTCIFGVNLYFVRHLSLDVPIQWHQLITCIFAGLIVWALHHYRSGITVVTSILLLATCILLYLVSNPLTISLRNGVLDKEYLVVHMGVHWLAFGVLLLLFYKTIALYRLHHSVWLAYSNGFIWMAGILLVVLFSVEMQHVYIYLTATVQPVGTALQQYNKAGLTIVWAIAAFLIMWIGMKYKYKPLRIISLALVLLALVKLFLFDIRNISEGGKIAAFILLGVLLLIISFMYQRLKKIIINDAAQ